jgi:hypothetical protein
MTKTLLSVLASGLLLAGLAAGVAGANSAPDRLGTDLRSCGKVNDAGGRSPVKSAKISCRRARSIARDFIQDDERRHGWKTYNPAGCEWFMYRKQDRDDFLDWQQGSGSLSFPVVYFIKMRGCES